MFVEGQESIQEKRDKPYTIYSTYILDIFNRKTKAEVACSKSREFSKTGRGVTLKIGSLPPKSGDLAVLMYTD